MIDKHGRILHQGFYLIDKGQGKEVCYIEGGDGDFVISYLNGKVSVLNVVQTLGLSPFFNLKEQKQVSEEQKHFIESFENSKHYQDFLEVWNNKTPAKFKKGVEKLIEN